LSVCHKEASETRKPFYDSIKGWVGSQSEEKPSSWPF